VVGGARRGARGVPIHRKGLPEAASGGNRRWTAYSITAVRASPRLTSAGCGGRLPRLSLAGVGGAPGRAASPRGARTRPHRAENSSRVERSRQVRRALRLKIMGICRPMKATHPTARRRPRRQAMGSPGREVLGHSPLLMAGSVGASPRRLPTPASIPNGTHGFTSSQGALRWGRRTRLLSYSGGSRRLRIP